MYVIIVQELTNLQFCMEVGFLPRRTLLTLSLLMSAALTIMHAISMYIHVYRTVCHGRPSIIAIHKGISVFSFILNLSSKDIEVENM